MHDHRRPRHVSAPAELYAFQATCSPAAWPAKATFKSDDELVEAALKKHCASSTRK